MSNLLAKRYKNNKAKAPAVAEDGKKKLSQQKVAGNNSKITKVQPENVQVVKETKTLILD